MRALFGSEIGIKQAVGGADGPQHYAHTGRDRRGNADQQQQRLQAAGKARSCGVDQFSSHLVILEFFKAACS
jgi:hypothetical protein